MILLKKHMIAFIRNIVMLFGKHKKIFMASAGAAALLIITGVALLVIKPWASEDMLSALGEAEAVMTTKIEVYDGIWDVRRYSDEFYYPIGITLSAEGIVVADSMSDRIQIIDRLQNRRIGSPGQYGLSYLDSGALSDGYRESALFMKPSGVALAPDGTIIISDTGNNVIRKMDDTFVITIAGNGEAGYQDGREGEVRFDSPRAVAVGSDGSIYVADTMNHCIRRIDTRGNVALLAGVPGQSGYEDGASGQAMFNEPSGLYLSDDGALYVADSANHSIRKIENGTVTTIAGQPGEIDRGYPQGGYIDGNNSIARFNFPRDVTMLPDGSLLVADSMNHAVRRITPDATTTLVGGGVADQYYKSAENLKISRPEGIHADRGTLYISDTLNNRVVAVPLTERILQGRPSRETMLQTTGISTTSRYAYHGEIRVFIGKSRVDMGRVPPWNSAEQVYVPIRPLFEALGAEVMLNERTNILTIKIHEYETYLDLDRDYFILRGAAVTTTDEIIRLFPYTFEWFPEYNLIALNVPPDLLE